MRVAWVFRRSAAAPVAWSRSDLAAVNPHGGSPWLHSIAERAMTNGGETAIDTSTG